MTKLVSGRVLKVPSANVSADRYEFIQLSETEPDLGLPSQLGQVPTSDLSGNRSWLTLSTDTVIEGSNLYYSNARVLSNVALMSINVLADVDITGIQNNGILIWNGTQFTAGSVSASATSNTALFAYLAAFANTAGVSNVSLLANQANTSYFANVAISVTTLSNFTTSNLTEGVNLYYTNSRVVSAVTPLLTTGNVVETTNQYFTNARVITAVTPLLTAANIANFDSTANTVIYPSLTTANVVETTNQYFTNARVVSAVTPLLTTGNVVETTNLYFTNARTITAITPLLTAANITNFDSRANAVIYPSLTAANIANFDSRANAVIWPSLNTANVTETSGNLYFTAARVNTVVQPFLTTANVTETSGNLYFTDARANAVIWPSLTAANIANFASRANAVIWPSLNTANVTESASNLYYSNARVLIGITTGTVAGNISVTDTLISNAVVTNSIFANSAVIGSGGSITGANLISATYIQANAWLNLYTSSVIESTSNLYFTNTRVVSALIAGDGIIIEANGRISANISAALANVGASFATQFANLTTAQVTEVASNLYFTNARAIAAFTAGENITIEANGRISSTVQQAVANLTYQIANLTTASIVEAASNLYFTTARVNATVQPFLTTSNVVELNNLYYTNSRVVSAVTPLLTTGNVVETTNQYFTNARVLVAVTPLLTTANVTESTSNLYFTTARVNATVQPFLTTANVIETSANLYFTNARARASLSAGTGVTYDAGNGIISIGQDVSITSNVTFQNVTISGNIYVQGNASYINSNTLVINDPLIQVGYGNPSDNYDLGWIGHYSVGGTERHAGFFRDHSDGTFKVFDNLITEPGSNDVDTANVTFRLANVAATTFFGNVSGTVGSLSNQTTTNLAEGTNQYFTNARVATNVISLMKSFQGSGVNIDAANGQITVIASGSSPQANISNFANTATTANTVLSLSNFTTANLAEGTNLYYTNARTRSAFVAGRGISISGDGVIKNTGSTSQYNLDIDGTAGGNVLSTMSPIVTFPSSNATDRFLLRSIHVVNTSGATVQISGNVLYATGNTAPFANLIPVAQGGVMEFIKTYQLFQPGDIINLQGFNAGEQQQLI